MTSVIILFEEEELLQDEDPFSYVKCVNNDNIIMLCTVWNVSKYGVFYGPYFPAFGLNAERCFVSLLIQSECGKIRTTKNSVFGHFSRSSSTTWIQIFLLLVVFACPFSYIKVSLNISEQLSMKIILVDPFLVRMFFGNNLFGSNYGVHPW